MIVPFVQVECWWMDNFLNAKAREERRKEKSRKKNAKTITDKDSGQQKSLYSIFQSMYLSILG